MTKNLITLYLAVFFLMFCGEGIAQENTSAATEIYLIESFVPPEARTEFHLTFYTSEACKAQITIAGKHTYTVTDTLSENHKKIINISGVSLDTTAIPFVISVVNGAGVSSESEIYEIQVPPVNEVPLAASRGGELTSCLYGAVIFAVPTFDYSFNKTQNSWGLSKELPLVSFYNSGYNFPTHFISAEYSYTDKARYHNQMRLGWKYLIDVNWGEFVVVGINGTTDFKGYNAITPEASWGLVSFNDVFTLYARYRFTTNFSTPERNSHTVSVGLYSWFFSVHR